MSQEAAFVDAEGNVNLQGGDVPEAEGLNFAEGAGAQEDPTAFEEFVKTSLPRLDIFDPTVFDMRMVLTVLALVGLIAYLGYVFYTRKMGGAEDDFFADLGISYSDFELPDEAEEFYALKDQGVDRKVLRNALLKRAIADIPIILRMQNEGPGMHNMYQQAMIGDKEWRAFQSAEQLVTEEIELVQEEAEAVQEGFSKQIWPMAMQLRQVLMQKQRQQQEEEEKKLTPAEEATSTEVKD